MKPYEAFHVCLMKQKKGEKITVGIEKIEKYGSNEKWVTQTNTIKDRKKMMTYSLPFSQLSPFKAARIYQDQSMQHDE